MNYLAHGREVLQNPYELAGTAIPDWMNVVDRRVRVRSKYARPLVAHEEPTFVASLARGVVRHHRDDDWFHRTRAFTELSMHFSLEIRDRLPTDEGLRPSFLGHILVEMLLDDTLRDQQPGLLEQYYASLTAIDPRQVADFVERATGKPVPHLADFVDRFRDVQFLYDYAEDGKLLFRLNQVMQRVGLAPLPDELLACLPTLRNAVRQRWKELLTPADNPPK